MVGRKLALQYGTPRSPISETKVPGTSPNSYLTSSGIAHRKIPWVAFRLPTLQSTLEAPLPAAMKQDPRICAFDEVISRWETTSGSAYTPKAHGGPCAQPRAVENKDPRRPLGIKSFVEKLRRQPGLGVTRNRKHQISEMKAQYLGLPGLDQTAPLFADPQPLEFIDHFRGGPSQALIPWTRNPELAGQPFTVHKMGALDRLQLYLTTSAQDFQRKELPGYPNRELICTGPLQKSQVPSQRQLKLQEGAERMRLGRGHQMPPPAVPHTGVLPLTRESYRSPVYPLCRVNHFCLPWSSPHPKPVPGIYSVPKAYSTENSRYGSASTELL
ncbi:uncharacterized protein LOC129681623 [Psammomys obesus]|uniref:uncharacterized protein LOC129681623 n=1 Tax=Psammomys obesus TaxID=48139 RepID=UPI0024533D2A|nr:uncharacterized protein LOC129681623 [Psammomys obesus]